MDQDRDRDEEHLVFVIRATNIVETRMKRVIAAFIKAPAERSSFVESYLLNNATVPFGAKVKLVLFIAKSLSVKVDRAALHILLSRRNAFAHQDHLESIRVVTGADGAPDVSFVIESIKTSGELETVTHAQAFADFTDAYAAVETNLDALLAALNTTT
jgi:uncharacterized protein YhhL (DUF1145 family)